MTARPRLRIPQSTTSTTTAAAMAALFMLAIGAGGTYVLMRDRGIPDRGQASATRATVIPQPSAVGERKSSEMKEVVVTVTKEAADRAGIELIAVTRREVAARIHLPGIVEPNAYRQVAVTPLAGGRIVRVAVQLGDRVRKGQVIAQVYSPDLAEAWNRYTAATAALDAHERELERAQQLVEIGAASRQELERIRAEHVARVGEVENDRSRLRLLGADVDGNSASQSRENATLNVPAPIDGVVTERLANAGLNVDATTKLFTIVDLSTVWIVADVYERDLHQIREGAKATITTTAYPDRVLEGRVGFIAPELDTATRTVKIRIEVPNPGDELRLGMYADVAVESPASAPAIVVPASAIQRVGEKQLVYLSAATDPTRYIERQIKLGRAAGDQVEVVEGLSPGDRVVSTGSFFLRAEAERLGLRQP